jgi:hypothetical protein
MERYTFNTVLVHTSREWERIRLTMPFEEMPMDNIESVDYIVEIAESIMKDDVIIKFMKDDDDWDWSEETNGEYYCSDEYIGAIAREKILLLINK